MNHNLAFIPIILRFVQMSELRFVIFTLTLLLQDAKSIGKESYMKSDKFPMRKKV